MSSALPKNIVVLGCTGSIGDTTLRVLESLGSQAYRVLGLSAGKQVDKLLELSRRWQPRYVCVADSADETKVSEQLPSEVVVLSGASGLREIAALEIADVVINGLVGAAGLQPTLAAARAGKTVGMANKEPLVMAGRAILAMAREHGAEILPLDSEPNAIWQCLQGESSGHIRRLILTASGGAFRGKKRDQLATVSPLQALAHPTWSMGDKITVDCATLMNKGFEVIEASWLFDVDVDQVDVVIHRESVIHSIVEFVDGSMLAHLGKTDMALPIQYALTHPARRPAPLETLDLVALGSLHFEEPDWAEFPCLKLCYEAGQCGGCAPAALNAANEVAVAAFLRGRIGFLDIYEINRDVFERFRQSETDDSLDNVLLADSEARELADALLPGVSHPA